MKMKIRIIYLIYILIILSITAVIGFGIFKFAAFNTGISIKYEEWAFLDLKEEQRKYEMIATVCKYVAVTSVMLLCLVLWFKVSNPPR